MREYLYALEVYYYDVIPIHFNLSHMYPTFTSSPPAFSELNWYAPYTTTTEERIENYLSYLNLYIYKSIYSGRMKCL